MNLFNTTETYHDVKSLNTGKLIKSKNGLYISVILSAILVLLSVMPQKIAAQSGILISDVTDITADENTDPEKLLFNTQAQSAELIGRSRLQEQAYFYDRQEDYFEDASFKSVNSSYKLDRFADYTVKDALTRFPGVMVGRRGDINIRGVGYNLFNVTVDGQKMGTTGMGSREIDLGSISLDLVQEIEISKVLTPDMDADGLSGRVNLLTRRPVINQRDLSVRIGGGGNTRYLDLTGPGSRAFIGYSDTPVDALSFSVNLSYQMDQRGWEGLGVGYDIFNGEDGAPVDVIDFISPGIHTNGQRRIGGNFQLLYHPNERSNFHVRTFINSTDREVIMHNTVMDTQKDWITSENTGNQGIYQYDVQLQNFNIQQHSIQTGAQHDFDRLILDYNVGWSHGSTDKELDSPLFQWSGLEYAINWDDRTRPIMQITDPPLQRDGTVNPRRLALMHHDRILERHIDNNYQGNLNIKFPFHMGSFKFGSSARFSAKDGFFSDTRYTLFGPLSVGTYSKARIGEFDVLDQREYRIPQFIDPYHARLFYTSNKPRMQKDDDRQFERSGIWNYDALENIYAGYGIATLEFGRFTVYAGARVEYTDANYHGRRLRFDDAGRWVETLDTNDVISYTNLFPNAQLAYDFGDRFNIRAAYSQSISRPEYNRLAPFELANIQDTTLFRGNSGLTPMTSDNLDLLFEYYVSEAGFISMGLFHKQLSGFNIERQRTIEIEEGDIAAFDGLFDDETSIVSVQERMFVNSDEKAEIYGVEFSWQQQLSFLPGFLGNFSTFANYTWSQSVFDVNYRDDEVNFPGHSPHVVNAALDYTHGRFSTQASYHWTHTALSILQHNSHLAPSIDPGNTVFMDQYEDGWSSLSISLRFRISEHFHFWADASNLLKTERMKYEYDRNFYPIETELRGGHSYIMGIQYVF